MYLVKRSKKYDRSFKRLKISGKLKPAILKNLYRAINSISRGEKLDQKFMDHALWGQYVGHRECHVQGDLLLVYKIEKDVLILLLADMGSHSYLFG